MLADERRVLQLGGVRNLRDVGGYPTTDARCTRWRTCTDRSAWTVWTPPARLGWSRRACAPSSTSAMTPKLRSGPNVFAASREVAYRHFPLFRGPPPDDFEPDLRRGYRREVDMVGQELAGLVAELVQPGRLPTLVHCAAGKDRTGVVIAVVLAAVGTERWAIAEDYALSQVCLGPSYIAQTREWVVRQGWNWSTWEHTAYTPPERMLETLAYVDERHWGVARYLADHGLGAGALAQLREALTEACADAGG
jgi:protein-tyrosine phosphatase